VLGRAIPETGYSSSLLSVFPDLSEIRCPTRYFHVSGIPETWK
jgi:hypothetical protein